MLGGDQAEHLSPHGVQNRGRLSQQKRLLSDYTELNVNRRSLLRGGRPSCL